MKKVILALAIVGSSVGSDCFCVSSMWDSAKTKIGSVMQKVQSNRAVQKIERTAQNAVKEIKSNRKAQVALGISVLVGGGILACNLLSNKWTAKPSILSNLKGSHTLVYECY